MVADGARRFLVLWVVLVGVASVSTDVGDDSGGSASGRLNCWAVQPAGWDDRITWSDSTSGQQTARSTTAGSQVLYVTQ
eukprot:9503432-Pyramimonas_sp.AAC.1